MDHYSYYQPFNHLQNPFAPVPAPAPEPEPADYYYAPASPSDFIYNSANATASIFRPSPPSHPSLFWVPNESASTPIYPPGAMGYGPSRPVEQSFPTYLPTLPEPSLPSLPEASLPEPSLPEPTPGLAEHRRQRQSAMNMGPGPSKSVPPPLPLGRNRGSGSSSSESTVVIKQEEGLSPSPVLVSVPMKKWEPRMPMENEAKRKGKFEPFGNTGMENEMGSGSGSGTWEDRGEGVVERVMPPMVPSMSIGGDMGMGMEPTIMPKMGLFKPIRWDGPSTSASSSSKARKARRTRAWEVEEGTGDVHPQRTYGNRNGFGSRSRNRSDETEDEKVYGAPISSHSRSPKRIKISTTGSNVRSESAETEMGVTMKIKQEPGLSPSPSAVFAQIPMYNGTINNTGNGYESPDHDDNPPSSRSISPLTRIPTPRRLLFPTPSRASSGTGTTAQPSLRGVSKQLKKRNRQMGLDREENSERSRERSRERRGEGFWSLAGGGGNQRQGHSATQAVREEQEETSSWHSARQQQQQQQQQYRGSSEEREEGWTTISGSSEEGEVSSHYENSYSCGQERNDAPRNTHGSPPFLPYGDQEWCHPFSSASTSATPASVRGSSSSARYGPGSAPSLSASQERVEQYRQAIQMVQDTCLEASKRYIRAHCVNRGVRGGGDSPDTCTLSHETAENRSARKARRKRKFKARHASPSSSTSSSSSSPSPPPSRRRRKGKGKRGQTRKRTTTTPPSSSSSPHPHPHPQTELQCTSSLLPNISQICTLLWSRSQSLRLHDIDSIELQTARNMYWLLSWAETVAFAVPPTPTVPDPDSTTSGRTSVGSSFPGFGVSSLENLAASGRGQWNRPSASFAHRGRDRDWGVEHAISPWENLGEGLNEEGYMWRRRGSEEGGGFEMLESRNGAVWEQQRVEMGRVFDEGGMLCEFLGYGEGVERLGRVRGFYGF